MLRPWHRQRECIFARHLTELLCTHAGSDDREGLRLRAGLGFGLAMMLSRERISS